MRGARLSRALTCGAIVAALASSFAPRTSYADASAEARDAEAHFREGALLFKDNDYAGALVEFKRAQEIAPNWRVFYNIGQAYYQLQHYAEAISAFEKYLAQGGAQVPAARRASLESDLQLLQARVARIEITVNVDGAEVRVDDEPVGTSPLKAPVIVSVGRRKITIVRVGKAPLERFVDFASGDALKMSFDFPEDAPPKAVAKAPAPRPDAAPPPQPPSPAPQVATAPAPSKVPTVVAWVATGVLAAGAATTGVLTLVARKDLANDLGAYPGDPMQIDHERSRTRTFATATDLLLAGAVVSAGVALYLSWPSGDHGSQVGLAVGPQGIALRGRY